MRTRAEGIKKAVPRTLTGGKREGILSAVMGRLVRDKLALVGLGVIVAVAALGLFAPFLVPHDPVQVDLGQKLIRPCAEYPLGTDHLGRCIFSRVIYGTRVSLSTAVLILTVIIFISVPVGTVSGYVGGKLDNMVMRFIDILLAFPGLVLALVIAGMLGPGLINVMIALSAVWWVDYARIIRSMVLSVKEKEFVAAARASGATHSQIIYRHVLPNIISPVIVLATLDMGKLILTISGLSFLGLGAQPPTPEWGAMLNDGRPYMQVAPHLMLFPGLAIMLLVLAFNLLGDGLRDAFDPRGDNRG